MRLLFLLLLSLGQMGFSARAMNEPLYKYMVTCKSGNVENNYYIKESQKKTAGMDIENLSNITFCLSPYGADLDRVCIKPKHRITEKDFRPFPPQKIHYFTWPAHCKSHRLRYAPGLGPSMFKDKTLYTIDSNP